MADLVDIDDMIVQVRSRTDQLSSTFIEDARDLIPWLNAGIAKVYNRLAARDATWFLTQSTVTTVSGTSEYALPSDFMTMNGVSYTAGSRTIQVYEEPFGERHQRQHAQRNVRYRVQRSGVDGSGVRIVFSPNPGARTYTIEYTPAPPTLEAGDSWDGVAGFAEYAIEFACTKVRARADEDPSPHFAAMRDTVADIEAMGHRRNTGGGGPRIARVRRRRGYRNARRGLGVP